MLTSGWNHWHHPCSVHVNREPLLKSVFNHHNPKQSKYFEHLTKDSYSQLTAKSASGTFGTAAVWPVAVEPRREQGTSLRNQRMEELCVRILRKQWTATLTNAQVRSSILLLIFISMGSQLTAKSASEEPGTNACRVCLLFIIISFRRMLWSQRKHGLLDPWTESYGCSAQLPSPSLLQKVLIALVSVCENIHCKAWLKLGSPFS